MTVCIVLNGEKFRFHTVILTLIGQCPMLNPMLSYFHILQYIQVSNGLNHFFLVIVYTDTHTHTDRQTPRHTDKHRDLNEYSIFAVD